MLFCYFSIYVSIADLCNKNSLIYMKILIQKFLYKNSHIILWWRDIAVSSLNFSVKFSLRFWKIFCYLVFGYLVFSYLFFFYLIYKCNLEFINMISGLLIGFVCACIGGVFCNIL